jgi:hypothetical protein
MPNKLAPWLNLAEAQRTARGAVESQMYRVFAFDGSGMDFVLKAYRDYYRGLVPADFNYGWCNPEGVQIGFCWMSKRRMTERDFQDLMDECDIKPVTIKGCSDIFLITSDHNIRFAAAVMAELLRDPDESNGNTMSGAIKYRREH